METVGAIVSVLTKPFTAIWKYITGDWLRYGSPVVMRTHTGRYVQVIENQYIRAGTKNIHEATIFYIVSPETPLAKEPRGWIRHNSLIALCYTESQPEQFVSARNEEQHMALGVVSWCEDWETFRICGLGANRKPNKRIFLKYGQKLGLISYHKKRLAYDTENEHRYFGKQANDESRFRDAEYVFLLRPDNSV